MSRSTQAAAQIKVTTGVKEQLKSIKCQIKSQSKYHSHQSSWNPGETAQLKQRHIFIPGSIGDTVLKRVWTWVYAPWCMSQWGKVLRNASQGCVWFGPLYKNCTMKRNFTQGKYWFGKKKSSVSEQRKMDQVWKRPLDFKRKFEDERQTAFLCPEQSVFFKWNARKFCAQHAGLLKLF